MDIYVKMELRSHPRTELFLKELFIKNSKKYNKVSIINYIMIRLYNDLLKKSSEKFVVILHFESIQGFGDISFATKIAKIISDNFKNATIAFCFTGESNNILIKKCIQNIVDRVSDIPKSYIYKSFESVYNEYKTEKCRKIVLDIATPSLSFESSLGTYPDFYTNTNYKNFDIYHIDEFCGTRINIVNSAVHNWYSSGIGSSTHDNIFCVGLPLRKIKSNYRQTLIYEDCNRISVTTKKSSKKRIQALNNLRYECGALKSKIRRNPIRTCTNLYKRIDDSQFFFAYISYIYYYDRVPINDFNPLYIHNFDESRISLSPYLINYINSISYCNKYKNFSKITIYIISPSYNELDLTAKRIIKMSYIANHRLNLIFKKQVEPDQFSYLLKKSNPEVLLTGDQSLIEGINLHKIIFYEVHPWKTSLITNLSLFAKDFDASQKSKDFDASQKSKDFDASQKSKDFDASQKSKDFDASQKSKDFDASQKSKDFDASQKSKDFDASQKSKDFDASQKSKDFDEHDILSKFLSLNNFIYEKYPTFTIEELNKSWSLFVPYIDNPILLCLFKKLTKNLQNYDIEPWIIGLIKKSLINKSYIVDKLFIENENKIRLHEYNSDFDEDPVDIFISSTNNILQKNSIPRKRLKL